MEDYFIFERDTGEPTSEGRLTYEAKLRAISPELTEQMKLFIKDIKKLRPELVSELSGMKEVPHDIILPVLLAKLKQYPTSVSDDEALLQGKSLSKRHRMAAEVRLGEKRLLEEAVTLVQGNQKRYRESSDERATKRAKH